MLQLFFFFFPSNWKMQFFQNQNDLCKIIAIMFESPFESGPGISGLTQLKSLSHFSIFYDEPFEFSIQNNLEFMPFFSFVCYILLPKKSQIKMKHFVQSNNIHIQFLLNSFKTWWVLFWIDKKSYHRGKKCILWPYACVKRVPGQCPFFKAQRSTYRKPPVVICQCL